MPFAVGAAIAGAIGLAGTAATVVGGAIGIGLSIGLSVGLSYGVQAIFGSKSGSSANEIGGNTQMLRAAAEPRKIIYGTSLVSGILAYAEVTGPHNYFLDLIIVLAGHPVHSIGDVYFNDKLSTDPQFFNSNVGVYFGQVFKHTGHETTADSTLVGLSAGLWTAAHKLQGCAYLYVRLGWDPNNKAWPGGIPNISAVVQGKDDIYDPRTGNHGFTNNWALCCADYLVSPMGLGADSSEIDMDVLIAAANLSDESVQVPDGLGGTTYQARYTCDGVIKTDQTPKDIMGKVLTGGAGSLVYTQGLYRLFGASYATPTVTLTESDLRGPLQVKSKLPRSQLFNTVKGRFVNPAQFWQVADFPPVGSDAYVAEDGGEIDNDIELPFTQDVYAAQRLATIHLRKSRLGVSVVMPCKLTALRVTAWDVVSVSIAALGWTAKPFRVTRFTFSADGGIDLQLQEELADVYSWNYGMAITMDVPPETNWPMPSDLAAPTGLGVSAVVMQRLDGSVSPILRISWAADTGPYIDSYELGWKPSGETSWNAVTMGNDATYYDVLDTHEGVSYNFRLRSVNTFGVKSPWATIDGSSHGKETLPNPPTGLSLLDGLSHIVATWAPPADNDIRGYEVWASTTNDRSTASLIVFTPAQRVDVSANPGTYYAWVRAVDTSGNQSAWCPAGQFAGVPGVSGKIDASNVHTYIADDILPTFNQPVEWDLVFDDSATGTIPRVIGSMYLPAGAFQAPNACLGCADPLRTATLTIESTGGATTYCTLARTGGLDWTTASGGFTLSAGGYVDITLCADIPGAIAHVTGLRITK